MNDLSGKPKLSLKKRENEGPLPTGPLKECPGCQAKAAEDAVICTKCGYNFVSGKRVKTRSGKTTKIIRDLILLVVILASLATLIIYGVKQVLPQHEDAAEKMKSALSDAKDQATRALEESGVKELVEEAKVAAEETTREFKRDVLDQTIQDPASAPATAASVSQEPVTPHPEVMDGLARKTTKQLDEKYPMATPGEEIILKTASEATVRGQIVKLGETSVTLYTETGGQTLEYDTLHRTSRIRCDAAYRKAYLTRLIEKKREAAAATP